MAQPSSHVYTFGDFRLDTGSGLLYRNNRPVPLTPKVYDTLRLLVENSGRLVEKDEFMKRVWPDTFVGDDALAQNVSLLRKAFAESNHGADYVVTVPKRGYRFVAPLEQQHNVRRHSRRAFPLIAASVLAAGLLALLWKWLPWVPGKAAGTSGRRAMAVIEIENLSQDPSLNWLGDGVVDLLTTDLAQAKNLDVISTERVRNLISREVKPGESLPASRAQRVAQKAGADIFISGALLNMGKGFRLNLRVQATTSGKVLLADKFEGDSPQAIFSMVDEATAHIVSQLTPAEAVAQPNAASLTSNLEALRAYEEGITYIERVFNDQAADSFRRATEFDPQFAMAYYQLAAVQPSYSQGRRALDKATQLAQRQGLPEQQRLLIRARQLQADGRSVESIQTFETIVRRFPKEIESRILLGNLLKYQGRLSESAAVLEEAARLDDPKRNGAYNGLAYTYAYQGDLSRALGAVDKYAALLPPSDPNPIDTRADIYAIGGRFDEAIAEYKKNVDAHPAFSMPQQKIALVYLLAGRNREAEETARTAYRKGSGPDRAFAANVLGDVAVGRGAFGLAAAYFAEAARLFETDYPYLAHADTWKAAEIYFEQHEPQAALFWARRTMVLGAAEVRGVAYLLLKNGPAAEREFAAARTAMVPLLGDYMAERFIAFDRLRAASYSGQWQRVIDGWPEVSGWLGPVDAFFPGRAHAEVAMLPQAEKELRDGLVWVSPGNLIGSYSDFLCYELTQFYLGKVFELEGKKTDAVDSYRAFVSHFTKSNARLPEIAEAQAALRRLS
jgi:DNA-binding winged helix-turn-helix (wHTH) protein/tetratricopeptide (TPR) repeat protein/TolB-like protein